MKANELRINNLYISAKFGTPVRCELSDLYELCIMADGAYGDPPIDQMFLSIPLTEEWLLKLGFKEHGYLKFLGDAYQRYTIGRNGIYSLDKKAYICEINEHDLCEIYFVHQLQNLYFALTGEELALKQ